MVMFYLTFERINAEPDHEMTTVSHSEAANIMEGLSNRRAPSTPEIMPEDDLYEIPDMEYSSPPPPVKTNRGEL